MVRREIETATEQRLRAEVKQQLRTRMQGLRRVLPQEARAARSAALCARLLELPELQRASTIVAYRATVREADPLPALLAAHTAGTRLGLPRIASQGDLELRSYSPDDPLERGVHGIDEPLADAAPIVDAQVDLIIVPALAFDDRGHRIGYGRGYYDRLLPRLPRAFKVVVGYDFQLVVQTPDTPGDIAVDCVVTDARTLRVQ